MALIDKASLLMVPSTYEDGTLYNILPSGNKAPDETGNHNGYDQTRADFTFSRGFNLAATRVNADGLIEKGRENLLLQSNTFDTTWATNNASVTSGQSGYDGSSNAWKLQSSSAGVNYLYQIISNNAVQTFSIYAKAGNTDWMRINILQSGTNANNYYDIANGVKGASPSAPIIDDKIESVGNGWYRISIVVNISITQIRIQTAVADGNEISASGDNIYIQDAQLEKSMVATDYIETGSSTAQAGILEDMPRINYDANGENGALLLESSRTNSAVNSEYHSGSTYGNNKVTTTDNEATSPEGLQNAAKIVLDSGTNTSNGGHYLSFSSTAGTTYTISVFAKAGEYRYFTFTYGSSAAVGGHFDLQEGVKLGDITNSSYTNTSASIEDYGNGWYRLIVTLTDNNSVGARFLSMKPSPSASVPNNNNYSSTGDGTSGAYIYGFQIETGASYASSYIPTHGAAVTRGADSCSVTGASDVIDSTQGTIYFEGYSASSSVTNYSYFISLSDGTQNNRLELRQSGDEIQFLWRVGGVYQNNIITSGASITDKWKAAVKYSSSEISFYLNGSEVGSISSPTLYSANTLNRFGFDDGAGSNKLQGKNEQLVYFNEVLSDSELATLTTL